MTPSEILKSIEDHKKIINKHCIEGNISSYHKAINIKILRLYSTVEKAMTEIKNLENKKTSK